MKEIIVMAFGLIIYSIASAQEMKGMDMTKKENTQKVQPATYTCVMHPEIHAIQPGNCPKCGMKLVKEKPKTLKQPVVQKHADMQMPKDTTKPIAMNMGKKDSMQMQPTTYTCPMHPEIHATKPGNCSKCGMKLIKEKPKAVSNSADNRHDGMQMSKDTSNRKSMDMDNMKMDDKPMDNMEMPKANLGSIKTIANNTPPRTVRYDLYVADTTVTFGKKSKRAIAVNGQIPMPTLTFTEGDTAEISVHNNLDEETSLHWHGLILPNQYDGVPNLTQMPIKPHTTHLYKFPII